jgi:hypothetical protein
MEFEQMAIETNLKPLEGTWLITKPAGSLACARAVGGKLLVPYSFGGEGKLTGHYYDCQVVDETLFCRFEQFDSAYSGVLFLTIGPNGTLTGGRWTNDKVPQSVQENISVLSESLPEMQPTVWIRVLKTEVPEWAKKYFRDEWPNKGSV